MSTFPNGAKFAFTILDDTDDTDIVNGPPVYGLLHDLGIKITKTVWAYNSPKEEQGDFFAGETLESEEYLAWTKKLFQQGFEIAFHNASMASSKREKTLAALNYIEDTFLTQVRLHCNHGLNKENLHWGYERYDSFLIRTLFKILAKIGAKENFYGNDVSSEFYWADIADERIKFIRSFSFNQLNCRNITPGTVFKDNKRQSKNLFFNTADAHNVTAFNDLVNKDSIDRLISVGGWTIVSTHLGKGFYRDGKLNSQFEETMRYIAKQNGYFVPVSDLLEHLAVHQGVAEMSSKQRRELEFSHLKDRFTGLV